MYNVRVTWSNKQVVDHEFSRPGAANAMAASYQYEVDHPEESRHVRGEVIPTAVLMFRD